jgi:APA family basic amino acid/polyamine antiporter
MPGTLRVRGRELPLMAVVGGLGTFAAWISVVVLHTEARTVGVAWMVAGMIGYLVYRRSQGLDPRVATKIERPARPVDFEELEYRSALVPIFGTDVDARALVSAARLVGPDAEVAALYVLPVPAQLSLDAGLEDEEATGYAVLEAARIRGRKHGLRVHTRLLRTRQAGAAIVEEAIREEAEIVYLATAHAPPSERALGPTATYLLAHRPCRIVIESGPAGDGRAGAVERAAVPAG